MHFISPANRGLFLWTNIMTPAAAPASNVSYMLGQLMDRTECLPELRDDVSMLKADMRYMRADFERHSRATDDELKRINSGAADTKEAVSWLRQRWQAVVVVAGAAAHLAWLAIEHYAKRGH